MEHIISKLLQDFEKGLMNRRQLIQSLALAATAASATSTIASAGSAAGSGFRTLSVDHISYQVRDYKRTRDFYSNLMGMTVAGDTGSQAELHFGDSMMIARNRRPVSANAVGHVDHIAFKIADWNTDKVRTELEGRGLKPRLDTGGGDGYASFHVTDPDGFDLQISGDPKPGDRLYKQK
jgi:catechol 2,3-dioxygenase-like lactoylglutathione lyase family enzyme